MEAYSSSPLPVLSAVWQPRPGAWNITVVCKATYLLRPSESSLAFEQDPVQPNDGYWDNNPARSLRVPGDLVPLKPQAEVMLIGSAYAPARQPVRSLVARLIVGDVDKSVEVVCDRAFGSDGALRDGTRFKSMPLRYERAAGGPGTKNPVGMRPGARDGAGKVALPNLQPPGANVASPDDVIETAGFGPIAAAWPDRLEKLGRHAPGWTEDAWRRAPLPEIDFGYFNASPRDMRLASLRDDERIVLENLHPDHPRLVTNLAGGRPQAQVEARGSRFTLPLRCDTLWIDTDRGVCTLTWRGQLPLQGPNEAGRVTITLEQANRAVGPEPDEDTAERVGSQTITVSEVSKALAGAAAPLPFAQQGPPRPREDVPPPRTGGGLPFVGDAPPKPVAPPLVPIPANVAPPPLVPVPAPAESPWAAGPPRDAAVPPTIGAVVAGAAPPGPPDALAPSNAAAAARPVPLVRPAQRELLQMLWLDADSMPRIRKKAPWKSILMELEEEGTIDPDADDPDLAREPAEIEDRRDVLAILVKGEAVEGEGIGEALASGVRDDGRHVPALALCSGELSFPFDELETLKATVTTVAPLVGADESLKAAVEAAKEFLKTPDLRSAPAVAEGLTARIRDAFAQGRRAVPSGYLDTQTERVLLEQRCYQRRELFGGTHLRALFATPGASGQAPAYLPAGVTKKLPLYQRFRARFIAEVQLAVDQYETHPAALRVLALGRLVAAPSGAAQARPRASG